MQILGPILKGPIPVKFLIKIIGHMKWKRLSLSMRMVASLNLFKSKVRSFLSDTFGA